MNIGELTATLAADAAPLRSAVQAAEREFRQLERTIKSVTANLNASLSRIAPIKPVDTRELRSAEGSVRNFGKAAADGFGKASDGANEFNNDLLKFGRTLASFAAVFYTVKSALGIFKTGIEFDKTMEENRLAMAALIGSMYEYQDASGKVVDSSRAFDAAMEDALALQKDLRIAGLATSATYQELAQGMQVAFAPAKEAGIKMEQLINFVQRFTQVMQVMTVPMNQMSEEVRSFLTGVMVPRQTRLESYWRGLGLTNEKIKELISNGKLYEEVMKRTAAVEMMATRASQTWSVSLSNLIDAFQNIMGVGLQGTFESLKRVFIDMFDWIVKINQETKEIQFNPDFLAAIQKVSGYMETAVQKAKDFKGAYGEFKQAHPVITGLGYDFASIALAIGLSYKALEGLYGLFLLIIRKVALDPFKSLYASLASIPSAVGGAAAAFAALPPQTKLIMLGLTAIGIAMMRLSKDATSMSRDIGGAIERTGIGILDWAGSFEIAGLTIKTHLKMIWTDLNNLFSFNWLKKFGGATYKEIEGFLDLRGWERNISQLKNSWDNFWNLITPEFLLKGKESGTGFIESVLRAWGEDKVLLEGYWRSTEFGKLVSGIWEGAKREVNEFVVNVKKGIDEISGYFSFKGGDAGSGFIASVLRAWDEDKKLLSDFWDNFWVKIGIGQTKATKEFWQLYDKQMKAAAMKAQELSGKMPYVYSTLGDFGPEAAAALEDQLKRVPKPEPLELNKDQRELMDKMRSLLAGMNEEASRLTDSTMVRLVAHMEKQNAQASMLLDKFREDKRLREFALFMEEKLLQARQKLIDLSAKRTEKDFLLWMIQNALPDAIGKYKEFEIRLEEVREKFNLDPSKSMEQLLTAIGDGLFNVAGKFDSVTSAAQNSATAVQGFNSELGSNANLLLSSLEKSSKGISMISSSVSRMIPPEFDKLIVELSQKYKVPTDFARAIMRLEAPQGFNPAGLGPPTRHGRAIGLMQLMPGTAEQMGFKPEEMVIPEKNIEAGIKYLRDMLNYFGNEILAGMAYNMGPGERGGEKGGMFGVLAGKTKLPLETEKYGASLVFMKGGAGDVLKAWEGINTRIKEGTGLTMQQAYEIGKQTGLYKIFLGLMEDRLSMQKSMVDALSRETLDISQSVELKRESLRYENELTMIKLEQYIIERKLSGVQADRLRELGKGIVAARTERTEIELRYEKIEKENAAWQKISQSMSIIAGVTPFKTQELDLARQMLVIQQNIRDVELNKWLEVNKGLDKVNPGLREMVKSWNEQAKAAENLKQVIDELKAGMGGIGGFFAAWSYERIKDSTTRAYESFKDLMNSLEQGMSTALGDAIIGALRGKKADVSEVFFRMAEDGIRRATGLFTAGIFDMLSRVGVKGISSLMKPDGTPNNPFNVWVKNMEGLGGGLGGGMLPGFNLGNLYNIPGLPTLPKGYEAFPEIGPEGILASMGRTSSAMTAANQQAQGFFGSMSAVFGSLMNQLGPVGGIIMQFLNGIASIFGGGGGGGGIGGLFGNLFGGLIKGVFGGFLGGGNPGWFTAGNVGGPFGGSWFQHGGYVTKPTMAIIGEAGPEYVIPEKKIDKFFVDWMKTIEMEQPKLPEIAGGRSWLDSSGFDMPGDTLPKGGPPWVGGYDQSQPAKGLDTFMSSSYGRDQAPKGLATFLSSLPKFQYGGSFKVEGPSGIDRAMVAFRATKGETVTVARPGEEGRGAGITINSPIYVSAPDPARFQASREHLEQKRLETIQRAIRNL